MKFYKYTPIKGITLDILKYMYSQKHAVSVIDITANLKHLDYDTVARAVMTARKDNLITVVEQISIGGKKLNYYTFGDVVIEK